MKEKYANELESLEKFYKLARKIISQKIEPPKETTKSEMER